MIGHRSMQAITDFGKYSKTMRLFPIFANFTSEESSLIAMFNVHGTHGTDLQVLISLFLSKQNSPQLCQPSALMSYKMIFKVFYAAKNSTSNTPFGIL